MFEAKIRWWEVAMLVAIMLFVLAVVSAARAGPDEDAAAALALAQAAKKPPIKVEPKKALTYNEGCKRSLETGLPLITYVGLPSVVQDDAVVCETASLPGFPAKCIVIARPEKDYLRWVKTLNEKREEVKDADPFARPDRRRSQGGSSPPWLGEDEQRRLRAMWPKSVPFPEGLLFYQRTAWGQRIADDVSSGNYILPQPIDQDTYFGNSGPALNPNKHVAHWRTPGGLDQVTRWTSHVAAVIPDAILFWEGKVIVGNAPGGGLNKKQWEFPVGTLFVDMLCDEGGRPFELRYREVYLEDGYRGWDSFVKFKDAKHRPNGYVSAAVNAGKSCADCHERADNGDGAQYHLVLRGGDGVRSFPVMLEGALRLNPSLSIMDLGRGFGVDRR